MQIKELPNRDSFIDLLPSNSKGVEIGVWEGVLSVRLAKKAIELHLVDFWTLSNTQDCRKKMEAKLRQEIKTGQVIVHDNDLINVLPSFPDNYFDWCYVDASHFYDEVKRDLELIYPKVKPNGLICGHDFTCTPDKKDWGTGVQRAVLEMVQDGKLKIIALTREFFVDYVGIKCLN